MQLSKFLFIPSLILLMSANSNAQFQSKEMRSDYRLR